CSNGQDDPVSGNEPLDHHGSHRDLLWSGDHVQSQRIDAIFVPTIRTPAYLGAASRLAQDLDCALVTLHSRQWTNAARAAQRLPRSVDLIAIDVPDPALLRLPRFQTSLLAAHKVFPRDPRRLPTDLSAKRNLGLVLSRLLGWSRVLFLDDDITGLNPADVLDAGGLLDTHNAVGLQVGGFPDHSVVCHAYRDAGGSQQSFIGGGALAVHVQRSTSFFPEIYNDDWFFLLDGDKGIQPVAMTGRVIQYPYDPFRNPERARAEEFGDVLAEGTYWLLDQHLSITDADRAHWGKFLVKRRQFIARVLAMVASSDIHSAEKARRIAALKGSLGRLALITPELCENYLRAWRKDRQEWQRFVQDLPIALDREAALRMLSSDGAPPVSWQMRGRSRRTADRHPTVTGPVVRAPAAGELTAPQFVAAPVPASHSDRMAEPVG
ncbi:MAG TPA: hypothetical protein VKB62_05990, partial [Streptosporangiaceae bacterium]|nr:hypothetical protein [Streptosporangiaceae bacterium]